MFVRLFPRLVPAQLFEGFAYFGSGKVVVELEIGIGVQRLLQLGLAFRALLHASDVDCGQIAMQIPHDSIRAGRHAALGERLLQLLFGLLEVGLRVVSLHRLLLQLSGGLVLRCGQRNARHEQAEAQQESIQTSNESAKFQHNRGQKLGRPAAPEAPNHSLQRASSAISLTAFVRSATAAALLLGCHAQQNFPGTALGPTAASAQLQLFEPVPARLDDQHSLTDLSFLNAEPAGAHGFVHAALGHFVDDRGSRLRFFGVNLSGIACLPDRETAPRLARHLRKLGFNAVRLHSLDGPGVLLANNGQFLPEALAQLDHFTAALKAEGIYFSLGLHASSGYPGLTGEAQQRFPHGKVLDRFHPPFLDAQRDFARQLLHHLNPETQLEYRAEPALLYLELNHEDTIFPSKAGSPDDVPPEFRAELAKGYAPWLAQRTAEGLRAPGPADEEAKAELPTFHGSPAARADYASTCAKTSKETCARWRNSCAASSACARCC